MLFGLHCQNLKISKSLSKIRRSGVLEMAAVFHNLKEKWLNKQLRKIIYFSNKSNLFLFWEMKKTTACFQKKTITNGTHMTFLIFIWHPVLSSGAVITIINKTKFHRTPQIGPATVHSPLLWEFIISITLLLSYIFRGAKSPEATQKNISTSEI